MNHSLHRHEKIQNTEQNVHMLYILFVTICIAYSIKIRHAGYFHKVYKTIEKYCFKRTDTLLRSFQTTKKESFSKYKYCRKLSSHRLTSLTSFCVVLVTIKEH